MPIYLVELDGLAPGSSTVVRLRYSTGEGFVTAPTDTPAHTSYAARVMDPGIFARHMWQPGTTRGAGEVSYGSVTLANLDGALDFLAAWDLDGQALTIRRGEPGAALATFTACFAGTMDGAAVSWSTVTVRVRDLAATVAARLVVTDRYLGNNVLPNGTEGTADDLKSRTKPLVIGECENFQPVRVNTSLLIYQVSAAPVAAIVNVWDNGNAVTIGTARANLAALVAAAPAAGTWDYSLGAGAEGAYIRLGSTPGADTITCYARHVAAASCTVAQCVQYVLGRVGIAPAQISGVAALDAVQPGAVGYFVDAGSDTTQATDAEMVTAGTSAGTVLDALCASAGVSWTPDRTGKFALLRLTPPTGVAAVTFVPAQLIGEINITPTEDDGRGVPSYEVELHYARNWTVQSGSGAVAGAVAVARQEWLRLAYRTARAVDAAIWNPATLTGRNPTSKPTTIETLLRTEAAATAEAARRLTMYGVRRTYVSFQVPPADAAALDLGTLITVATPRFGLASKLLAVTGLVENFGGNVSTVFAWG